MLIIRSGVPGLLHGLNWLKVTDVSGRLVGCIIGVTEKLFGNQTVGETRPPKPSVKFTN
jgi:hypothetical protein